jgi:hypothetical protein
MNVIEILNYEINLNFIFRKIVIDCSVIVANAQMTFCSQRSETGLLVNRDSFFIETENEYFEKANKKSKKPKTELYWSTLRLFKLLGSN